MSKILIASLALVALSSSAIAVPIRKVFSTKERMTTPADRPKLGSFGSPSVNDFGEVAVVTTLFGPRTFVSTSLGILFGKKVRNSLLLARRGQFYAPEFFGTFNLTHPDPKITDLDDFTILTNKKDVAFSGEITGAVKVSLLSSAVEIVGGYIGVANPRFLGSPNPFPRMVAFAAEGDNTDFFVQLPYAFHEMNKEFAINNKGRVAFIARSTNDNTFGKWDGIWYGGPGTSGSILTIGEVVHGLPFNSDYASFGGVALSPINKVYTIATITNKGAGFFGIWSGNDGFMSPVVTRLTRKPEDKDLRFGTFTTPITVSRKGKVLAFPSDGSIWVKRNKKMFEAAAAGDIVGKEFKDPEKNETLAGFLSGAAVNSKGQIAFLARTTLEDVTSVSLIASVGKGKFVNIARVGDKMRVNGRGKEIINLELNVRGGLNELGVVTFTASFIDRTSAVFLARTKR